MSMMQKLWNDEVGFIISSELILIATILVIGMIVGLTSVRDQVVQELADVAEAISDISQSYSYTSVTGHTSFTAGSDFVDITDFCDANDGQSGLSACVNVNVPPNNGNDEEAQAP